MKPAFRLSVVIPTHNRATVIRRAIDSVLAQTCQPEEIIVVDDGSTDSTRQVIESDYGGKVRYIYQHRRGVSSARNTGIAKSNGDWIAFLDSDDEWQAEKLQSQLAALGNEPGYTFCHTNEIWIRNGTRVNGMLKHEKSGGLIFEKCLPLCVISPSSVLIKKTVFDEIGLFDEDLPVCEDYDFWLRYCWRKPVLYIEKPLLVKYGGHADQLSTKYYGMDRFRLHSLLKLISSQKLSDDQKADALETFNKKMDILLKGARKHQNTELLELCKKMKSNLQAVLSTGKQPQRVFNTVEC